MNTYICKSPVLFLIFNRPDVTAQVFEAIRAAKPTQLYVASDGARAAEGGEQAIVDRVREIATNVDWDCEVKTLFRDENLGCGKAVSGAIDWFFEDVEAGIILEDDCLPNCDFFRFCDVQLKHYQSNRSVWHICGNNFGASNSYYKCEDYSFISLAQVWGWATWRDRWQKYEYDVHRLEATYRPERWRLSRGMKQLKLRHIESLKSGLDTWDFQWQITVLNNKGYVISPSVNLISNLGDGHDATHTLSDSRCHLRTDGIEGDIHIVEQSFNKRLARFYERKMGTLSLCERFLRTMRKI